MTPDEIAAMQADALAGTPGEWVAEEKPGQLSEHGSQSSIGLWAQARWDSAYEADPDDTDAADDAAWLCGIWGKLTDEDHANARRIARVPRMETAIMAQAAEIAELKIDYEGMKLEAFNRGQEIAAQAAEIARLRDALNSIAKAKPERISENGFLQEFVQGPAALWNWAQAVSRAALVQP